MTTAATSARRRRAGCGCRRPARVQDRAERVDEPGLSWQVLPAHRLWQEPTRIVTRSSNRAAAWPGDGIIALDPRTFQAGCREADRVQAQTAGEIDHLRDAGCEQASGASRATGAGRGRQTCVAPEQIVGVRSRSGKRLAVARLACASCSGLIRCRIRGRSSARARGRQVGGKGLRDETNHLATVDRWNSDSGYIGSAPSARRSAAPDPAAAASCGAARSPTVAAILGRCLRTGTLA